MLIRIFVNMDELTLPVSYHNEELELPVRMYPYGSAFRVEVMVGETAVIFERDEEGSYRALIPSEQMVENKNLTVDLLRAIGEALGKLV